MEKKMNKLLITLLILFLGTSFIFAQDKEECTDTMGVYAKQQTITSNLLNYLSDPSKMKEVTDYYGEQNQIGEAYMKEGKYKEACDTYQGVIDKYGMKTIEEQYYEKYPEKRPGNQKTVDKSGEGNAVSGSMAAESAAEASGNAVAAPDSVSDSATNSANK